MMKPSELNKVLYVEDDPFIQRIAQLALENVGGLELRICISGKEALTVVQAFNPDLILLDMMLPEMDGFAIQDALRSNEQTAAIPVVFMTAKVQKDEVEQYHKRGAMGVISKPFNPMTLAGDLRELWNNAGNRSSPAG